MATLSSYPFQVAALERAFLCTWARLANLVLGVTSDVALAGWQGSRESWVVDLGFYKVNSDLVLVPAHYHFMKCLENSMASHCSPQGHRSPRAAQEKL